MFRIVVESVVELVVELVTVITISVILALIFWVVWINFGIGPKYFAFLPTAFLQIGFWDTVGVFLILAVLKAVALPSLSVKLGKSDD